MSTEELREDVQRAVKRAVADDVEPDEIESVLEDMQDRIERIRILESGQA